MQTRSIILLWVLLALVTGCAPQVPRWREDALLIFDASRKEGADRLLPAEFRGVADHWYQGEDLRARDDIEGADRYYRLVLEEGEVLEANLAAEKKRLAEEAQRNEQERLRVLAEAKARHEEELRRDAAEKERLANLHAGHEQSPKERSHPLPSQHTVRQGETLPLIASLPEIYNETALWPLLYRANRDQIRDPMHVSPGQVLRVPRNLSREEIVEARRYSSEKSGR